MFRLIFASILFVSGVVLVAFESWKKYVNRTKLKNFVVLNAPPLLGNLVDVLKCDGMEILELPNTLITKYNVPDDAKCFFTWMGHMLFMYSDHPETYEAVLCSDKATKKAYAYKFLRNTRGMLTSIPTIWKAHRKALHPTLGQKMVDTFLPIFNEKSKKMVDLMEKQIDSPIDMHRKMFGAAVDSIFHASFDTNWSMQNEFGDDFREGMMEVFERVQLRFHTLWMKPDFVYNLTKFKRMDDERYPLFHRLIESIFVAKKLDFADKLAHGYDEMAIARDTNSFNFIQKCFQMELEQKFDEKDILEEMETIVIGSADTTALIVTSTILMLAIHQEYQDRVVDELRSIFASVDEPVAKEHLAAMQLMELVIKESLRLFPPAPYLAREADGDIPMHGGIIPKGTQIVLNFHRSNRSTKYFGENANEFHPERFLPENCAHFHPFQFIPFSGGLRNCPGIRYGWASLKIAITHLLRHYKFTTDLKLADVKVRTGMILKIANEDPVRIERREW